MIASELAHDLEALDIGASSGGPRLTADRLVAPPASDDRDHRCGAAQAAGRELGSRVSSSPTSRCGSAAAPSRGRSARRTASPPSRFPPSAHCTSRRACGVTLLELVGELARRRRRPVERRRCARAPATPLGTRRPPGARHRHRRSARALGDSSSSRRFVASHLRLLLGMVRANRPWRLAARLYRALLAAVVAGAYGLRHPPISRRSRRRRGRRDSRSRPSPRSRSRSGAVIVAHGLWERAPNRHLRDQAILFNVATAATILIGIATRSTPPSSCPVFAYRLNSHSARTRSPRPFGHSVGTRLTTPRCCSPASLAMVGGALGAGLGVGRGRSGAACTPSSPTVTNNLVARRAVFGLTENGPGPRSRRGLGSNHRNHE